MKKGAKMKKAVTADEPLISLSQALRQIRENPDTAWMPITAMRRAVRAGRVPSRRTSRSKKAWYYVKMSDLLKTVV